MTDDSEPFQLSCPLPHMSSEFIKLGHGSGGVLSAQLLQSVFLPAFKNKVLSGLEDQAALSIAGAPLAFTTDSFVIRPIFFPGGDIGSLSIHGTLNDLAVGGAKPLYIAASFILEEGLAVADLERVVQSMRRACDESGVLLVTGDTKVVDRGKGDKIYITTTGLGLRSPDFQLSMKQVELGDKIIVSGTVGDHGMAIMSAREGLEFETALESDSASLLPLTELMLGSDGAGVHWMRDATRGGLSAVLNELVEARGFGLEVEEKMVPVRREVKGACEMLGLDPLYVANEGKLVAAVAADRAEEMLERMRGHALGRDAAIIGTVTENHKGRVILKSALGGSRALSLMLGELLPRIC